MNVLTNPEINSIKQQIIKKYNPEKIIVFGSSASGTVRNNSDIDVCVIKETSDKRELLTDIYLNIESSRPFDLVLYTIDEWADLTKDRTSFAYQINKKGLLVYDR